MYLDHFGFDTEPFNITPDSRFLYMSRRHREAMASLLYGIEHRKGFIALTGEIGSGKTTICRALLKELDRESINLALILNPQLSDLELLQAINHEFGIPHHSHSKRELLSILNEYLLEQFQAGKNSVLVIDEAQRLTPDVLEQVRLISNLELENTKLIQIALVGQPELDELLHLPELEQLNQRITVRCHIDPLDSEEASQYIIHRINVANPKKLVTFSKRAFKEIYAFTEGIPRKINVVCDRALLVSFVSGKTEVGGKEALKAIEEVRGTRPGKRHLSGVHSREEVAKAPEAARESSTQIVVQAPAAGRSGNAMALAVAFGFVVIALAMMVSNGSFDGFIDRITGAAPPYVDAQQTGPDRPGSADYEPGPALPEARPASSHLEESAPAPEEDMAGSPEGDETSDQSTDAPAEEPEDQTMEEPGVAGAEEIGADTSEPAEATPTPEPTPSPAPTPAPSPAPEEVEEEEPVRELAAVMATDTTAEPEAEETITDWRYDSSGICRVTRPEFAFVACILTWLKTQGHPLGEDQLRSLRDSSPEHIATFRMTEGKPPLYLRTARLPPNFALLRPSFYPAVAQIDRRCNDYGPWAILMQREGGVIQVLDPQRGRLEIIEAEFEQMAAAFLIPYNDRDGITGLSALDEGDAVTALQERLAAEGLYEDTPSGTFDEKTVEAVMAYRRRLMLPGPAEIDPLLALSLLEEPK